MKTYELTIFERLLAMDALPKESNIVNLRIKQSLIGKIGLSADEYKEYEIKEDGPNIKWNPEKSSILKKIELKDREADLIKEALRRLDGEQKLTSQHLSLYEKFIEDKGEKDADT
jgi:hypothetical protein